MLTPLVDGDPRRVGPFTIHNRIGAGGMGTVYLGFNAEGRAAAVKVPDARFAGDPEFRERFRREVAAARRVHGRAVAAVLDADPDASSPWLATEYVEGTSLADAVLRHGRMEERLLHGFSVGLADALIAIHAVGVVHRDLKPSNILLAWDGPKVIDFGIARAAGTPSHTRTGILIGTLAWMAPEQLRGERAGPAADIFAWGACVTYAATGHPPFASEEADVLNRMRDQRPPDIAGVPEALVELVRAALTRHPQDRPSAADLVRGLVADPQVRTPADADRAAALALTPWQARPPLSSPDDRPPALDPDRPDQPTHPLALRPTPPPDDDHSAGTVPVPRRPGQTDPRLSAATQLAIGAPRQVVDGSDRGAGGSQGPGGVGGHGGGSERGLDIGPGGIAAGGHGVGGHGDGAGRRSGGSAGVPGGGGRLEVMFGWLPAPWRRAAPLASVALLIVLLAGVVVAFAASGGGDPQVEPTPPPAQGGLAPGPGGGLTPDGADPRRGDGPHRGPSVPAGGRPSAPVGTTASSGAGPSATAGVTTTPSPSVPSSPSPSVTTGPTSGASPTTRPTPSTEPTVGASPSSCPTGNPNGAAGSTPPAC